MNNKSITDVRNDTYEQLIDNLNKEHKCLLVRPTSFGKTWIISALAMQYERVIFVYPSEAIRNTFNERYESQYLLEKTNDKNVIYISYQKLAINIEKSVERVKAVVKGKRSVIIFDEAHRMGGNKCSMAIRKILNIVNDNFHAVGATATPLRGDAFSIIKLFDGVTVSQFTLHDAIKTGIVQKPLYYYFDTNLELNEALKKVQNVVFEEGSTLGLSKSMIAKMGWVENGRKVIKAAYKSRLLFSKDTENNLKESFEKAFNEIEKGGYSDKFDKNYMKFLIYSGSQDSMVIDRAKIDKIFKKIFKGYEINSVMYSSNEKDTVEQWFEQEYGKDYEFNSKDYCNKKLEQISKMHKRDNKKRIDLIYSVEMLGEGFHDRDITGVIFNRCTYSSIVYNQQLGRALSSDSGVPSIVIDIACNIGRQNRFNKKAQEKVDKRVKKVDDCNSKEINLLGAELHNREEDRDTEKIKELTDKIREQIKKNEVNIKANDMTDSEIQSEIIKIFRNKFLNSNTIYVTDIHSREIEATIRELIVKTVVLNESQMLTQYGACYWDTFIRVYRLNNDRDINKIKEAKFNEDLFNLIFTDRLHVRKEALVEWILSEDFREKCKVAFINGDRMLKTLKEIKE